MSGVCMYICVVVAFGVWRGDWKGGMGLHLVQLLQQYLVSVWVKDEVDDAIQLDLF